MNKHPEYSLSDLWEDIDGPNAMRPIWTDEHAAAFLGYSTTKTVVKNRSQKIGAVGRISWFRFGRGLRCKPRELAEAVTQLDIEAA